MRLKHGKKYETADGVVYRVRSWGEDFFEEFAVEETDLVWLPDGSGTGHPDLIRRHYTKPKPAHKLDLKPGDVVELVAWEDGSLDCGNGRTFNVGSHGPESNVWYFDQPKGERPLFLVVSRVSWTKPPS